MYRPSIPCTGNAATQLGGGMGRLGCMCGGKCGLGLFDSGLDFTGWGIPEIVIVALGGYMLLSTVFTTSRAVKKVKAIPGERRKRKAAHYRKLASELSKKKT
jgi:ribose/xylose/arabinose/galactoside ABC-type transport system permease subunit